MDERRTSMIPRYGKLNKIYAEIMSGGSFSFEQQQFISDIYREYVDTQTFEAALISLTLEMDATHYSVLLNSLKREIESRDSMDETYRRLRYVRYADDFLIGVIGSKAECVKIKSDITKYMDCLLYTSG